MDGGGMASMKLSPSSSSALKIRQTSSEPDHHLRTQVCSICHIDTKSYHLNYGVSSCLSCRAFFRRIVQQKMKTEMKCKGGRGTGPCVITPENRKKCKKCRYEACLRAGMRAESVMNEDQYKVWFRRMLRKQKKEGKGGWGCNKQPGGRDRDQCGPLSRGGGGGGGGGGGAGGGSSNEEDGGSSDDSRSVDRDLDYFLGSMEMMRDNESMASTSPEPPEQQRESMSTSSSGEGSAAGSPKEQHGVSHNAAGITDDFSLTRICPGILPNRIEEDVDLPILTVEDAYVKRKAQQASERFATRWEALYSQCKQEVVVAETEATCKTQESRETAILEFIKKARTRWGQACQQARVPISEFSHKLYKLHRRNESFTNTLLRSHLDTLSSLFAVYSGLFPEFKQLPAGDQRQLLEQNTKLFVQYFLGRYFYAGSGFKQTQWLLLCQVPDFMTEDSYLRFIPITTFNGMLHVFTDQEALDRYQEYAKELSNLVLGVECNCAIALLTLFSINDTMMLEDLETVKRIQSLALEVTGYGHQKFNCAGPEVLQSILALCSRMAASFEQSVAWEENYLMDVAQNPSSYLPMDQSGEEAAGEAGAVTLATMVQAFEESFDVYPFGEELIQEYIMYNLGVPFSKTFLPRICLVIADRFRSVLGQCGTSCSSDNGDGGEQGFEGDAAAKKEDEDLRVFRAVSLFLVKLESCPDAKCQLESALGSFDREVVNRKFSPKLHVSASNDKVTMSDFTYPNSLTEGMLSEVESNVKAIYRFVYDYDLFRSLCLSVLFGVVSPGVGVGGRGLLSAGTEAALVGRIQELGSACLAHQAEEEGSPSPLAAFLRQAHRLDNISATIRIVIKDGINP